MSRKNYYEILTSLHFDNKMDTDIKVKEAIATWKENITLNYNKETDPVIKDNIKQENGIRNGYEKSYCWMRN